MRLQILQENFSKALSICSRFASSRVQLPVLANVLLKVSKNKLIVAATNLELSVSMSLGAKVEEDGEITVPSRVITDIVNNLNPGQVSLSSEKEILKITSSGFESSVAGMNASDFPSIPQEIGDNTLKLPSKNLQDVLVKTLFAVSTDETRPVLTGQLVILKKGELIFVATDGFRLSQVRLVVSGIQKEDRVVIPKNALLELIRLDQGDEDVAVSLRKSENQILFKAGDAVLTSRIIEGEYPDFEKIIPKSSKIKVLLDKEDLFQAVKLASVYARDSANVIKLGISEDEIEISSESSHIGSQKRKLEAKVESDFPVKEMFVIAFNYRFLEEFLGAVKNDDVRIEVSDPNAPAIFLDPKEADFLHIIMPVRLQG